MLYPFRNLVFEGGGVKGLAYVGALEVLEQKGILPNILRVGGTSAGAINALLLGLNYSLTEIKDILSKLDFQSFIDDSWGIARDTNRLLTEFGWYKGDSFRRWIGELIRMKTGNSEATFADIHNMNKDAKYREMYFVGANLSTRFAEVFSYEHTPRMCVADAVRISMSIPLVFAAKRSLRGDVYVDGGLLDNYPVRLFDRRKYVQQHFNVPGYYSEHNEWLQQSGKNISPYVYNKETLGFRLDSTKEVGIFRDQAEPEHHQVDDFFDYVWSLMQTVMESQQSRHLQDGDWHRTIYIDTLGVGTTEFDISEARKTTLMESGKACAIKYFQWYEDTEKDPAINLP